MTARACENVNTYILLFKTRHLKPVSTRHQLQGSIVYWRWRCCYCWRSKFSSSNAKHGKPGFRKYQSWIKKWVNKKVKTVLLGVTNTIQQARAHPCKWSSSCQQITCSCVSPKLRRWSCCWSCWCCCCWWHSKFSSSNLTFGNPGSRVSERRTLN